MRQILADVRLPIIATIVFTYSSLSALKSDEPRPNAALQYWIAFDLMPHLSQVDAMAASDNATNGFGIPLDSRFADLFRGNGTEALEYFHRGARIPSCDWGIDLRRDGPFTYGGFAQTAHACARFVSLHARWSFEHDQWTEGIDDVIGIMTLARHMSRDNRIVNFIHKGCDLDYLGLSTAAAYLPKAPRKTLELFDRRLDDVPAFTSMNVAYAANERVLDWAIEEVRKAEKQGRLLEFLKSISCEEPPKVLKEAQNGDGLVRLIEDARLVQQACARLFALSPSEYEIAFQKQIAPRLKANPIAVCLGPSYRSSRVEEATASCRLKMLRVAIDVLQNGEDAIRKHSDPYGDGPFKFTRFDGGFELASKLNYLDSIPEIKMNFGMRKKR